MLKTCVVKIEGKSPYSPARGIDPELMMKGESHDAFDKRIWREKATLDADGHVVIPPSSVQIGLYMAAKGMDLKFGKKAGAGFIETGVLAMENHPLFLPTGARIVKDDLEPTRLFLPSDGKALHKGGKGSRVWRTFPIIHAWSAELTVEIFHEELQRKEVMKPLFERLGMFVGFGRYRPERGGYMGRFAVKSLSLS